MSAFQDAPKPRIVRFIRGFTNFLVDPYYDPLSLVMTLSLVMIQVVQAHLCPEVQSVLRALNTADHPLQPTLEFLWACNATPWQYDQPQHRAPLLMEDSQLEILHLSAYA